MEDNIEFPRTPYLHQHATSPAVNIQYHNIKMPTVSATSLSHHHPKSAVYTHVHYWFISKLHSSLSNVIDIPLRSLIPQLCCLLMSPWGTFFLSVTVFWFLVFAFDSSCSFYLFADITHGIAYCLLFSIRAFNVLMTDILNPLHPASISYQIMFLILLYLFRQCLFFLAFWHTF